MMTIPLDITILGLTITSSWGNGHATTWRGLVHALARRGHRVHFLERDAPWYRAHRDLEQSLGVEIDLYERVAELQDAYRHDVRDADLIIVGSYVPDGIAVGEWVCREAQGVTAFYDIDTPVTLAMLRNAACEYITAELVSRYDCYLSFSGGPVLRAIEKDYGSPLARALYCSADPAAYCPESASPRYDLGYLGTWSADRQPPLEELMLDAARAWPQGRFIVAGPQYPDDVVWPANVKRNEHVPPVKHRRFYNELRFAMNITRQEMIRVGWSPSIRLFEAAACGTAIISDYWPGLEDFFTPEQEILISRSHVETLQYLRGLPDEERKKLGEAARRRVLQQHTADKRAEELEEAFEAAIVRRRTQRGSRGVQSSVVSATNLRNTTGGEP